MTIEQKSKVLKEIMVPEACMPKLNQLFTAQNNINLQIQAVLSTIIDLAGGEGHYTLSSDMGKLIRVESTR